MAFDKIASTPSMTAYRSGPLYVFEFSSQGKRAEFEIMDKEVKSGGKAGKVSTISISRPSVKVSSLDEDSRAAIRDFQAGALTNLLASAVVIEGNSLSTMVIRTIVTGINALKKSAVPTKCFATADEALAWLKELPGQDARVKKLDAADLPRASSAAKAA